MQFLHDYGEALLNIALCVSLLFPFVIGLWWRWWESDWGKNIVALEMGIAITLFPAALFIDWDIDLAVFRWLQVIGLTIVPVVVIHRAYLIIKTQREGAVQMREEREDPDATISEVK